MLAALGSVLAFFALAYALSWLAWAPLVAVRFGLLDGASAYWHLAGGLGPALAAVLLTAREGRAALVTLARRTTRAPVRWIVFAVGAPVALFGASAAILALAGADVDLSHLGTSPEYPALGPAAYIALNVVCYGVGEEVGWRGYALPHLLARTTRTRATLIVAAGWAAWHLPLFAFASGMAAMGPAAIVGWLASLLSGALLMTWLYERSGSVLAPALFHATLDVVITSPTGPAVQSTLGALVTIAGFVLPAWSARRDARRR